MLFVNPERPRVDLAPEHARQPYVAVPLYPVRGLGPYEVDPQVTGVGVSVTMPDPDGGFRRVSFPWDAVFAVADEESLRTSHYPENWPERLWEASRLRRHLEDHGTLPDVLPEGFESGPGPIGGPTGPVLEPRIETGKVYLGRTPEGRALLAMKQPLGPQEPSGDRPILELYLALDELPSARDLTDPPPCATPTP
jgi:hypothetical protein